MRGFGWRLWAFGLAAMMALGMGPAWPAAGSPSAAMADWIGVGGSPGEPHYSGLTQINRASVKRLGLAWSLDLPGEHTLEAPPLAVDGVLYFTGQSAKVYAVDAATGQVKWTYDPQSWTYRPRHQRVIFPVNRGVAYADGKVFVGTLDGRLIALGAGSGQPVWTVKTVADDSYDVITGAPRIAGDKVVIGQSGGDYGARGYVTAYDIATGRQVWRFYVVPGSPDENRGDPAMERAAKTWGGEYWKTGTGGTPWDSLTYDPDFNRLYIGTSNAFAYGRKPEGDRLYTNSIVAVDADTGRYVWHYQTTPSGVWDFDSTQQMTLADLVIGGRTRKVLMQAPKNGFFYEIDRATGKLISAEKFAKATWAERIDLATGRPVLAPSLGQGDGPYRIWPGVMGAHNWQAMAYSPRTGLVYIPAQTSSSSFSDPPDEALQFGQTKTDGTGSLLAWDPARQTARWSAPHPHVWNGGVLASAGDVVFQGDGEGVFHAYDATDGRELWRFDAGLGIVAPPTTYLAGGRQYVSVLVGYGGGGAIALADKVSWGWKYGRQPRRLLTFALDRAASLPATPPRDPTVRALDDASLAIDPAAAARGAEAFGMRCLACHGAGARSPGAPAPDLRESPMALSLPTFTALLQNGGRERMGMPRFDDVAASEARDLYMYIRAQARQARAGAQAGADSHIPACP